MIAHVGRSEPLRPNCRRRRIEPHLLRPGRLPHSPPFSRSLVLAMSWVAGGTRGYIADRRCAGGRRNFDRARRSCAAYLFYVRPTSTQLICVYSCAMPRRRQLFVAGARLRLRVWLKKGLIFSSSCQPACKGSDVGDEGPGDGVVDCGLEVPCETAAAAEPGEGAFDDPTARDDFESPRLIGALLAASATSLLDSHFGNIDPDAGARGSDNDISHRAPTYRCLSPPTMRRSEQAPAPCTRQVVSRKRQ